MLALVVVYLLNANRQDRQQYEQAIDRAEERANEAEKRTRVAREVAEDARKARFAIEETLGELRAELALLRKRDAERNGEL